MTPPRFTTQSWTAIALSFIFIAPGMPQAVEPPRELRIVVLDGEGALNNIRLRSAREPIVQVEDENHKPVAGAVVLFMSPEQGPGGVFLNGSKSLTVTTDAKGQAVARGFKPNQAAGEFAMQVSASYQGVIGRTVIRQQNVLPPAAISGVAKWLLIGATVGGAVGGGVWAATSGHANNPAPGATPATITAGGGSVGPPR